MLCDSSLAYEVQAIFKQFVFFASVQAVLFLRDQDRNRWTAMAQGATRSLSQRLRLSREAFIS